MTFKFQRSTLFKRDYGLNCHKINFSNDWDKFKS